MQKFVFTVFIKTINDCNYKMGFTSMKAGLLIGNPGVTKIANCCLKIIKCSHSKIDTLPVRSKGKILAMTFPKQDLTLGLEPSVLNVLPDGENVKYIMDYNHVEYPDNEVDFYLCSVYITGMKDFIKFAQKLPRSKIIAGGYEPTMNPREFLPYAEKVITGPCDSFWETMGKPGRIVKGITSYKRIPRYDLYDIKLNQQIIPDKKVDDIVTSINTSMGCPNKCDFCCSPLMSDHVKSAPLSLVKAEIEYKKQYNPKYNFIRDENFPLQKDWKEKLEVINELGAKTYLFASANLLSKKNVQVFKKNNVYMVCLGLEDITVKYRKNIKLDEACDLLHKNGIYTYLSFIVDPLKINTDKKSDMFYKNLLKRLEDLKPEMVCGNFLMPFRGTPLWNSYKHLVTPGDFQYYNSKSAFLEKDPIRRFVDEYNMFKFQWDYYTSKAYN